jgi:nucleoid DNA-binding protein
MSEIKINIQEDIKELLYENGTVVIPNFGSLKGEYKSASIDGFTGQITPPSMNIHFDSNIIVNDGILLEYIRKKHQINADSAQKIIDTYVENFFERFNKHELVAIPEVGRFYLDSSKKVQYLTDNTNFNTDSYGLPTVQFYPVSRTKPEAATASASTTATETLVSTPPPISTPTTPFPEAVSQTAIPTVIVEKKKKSLFPEGMENLIPVFILSGLVLTGFLVYFLISWGDDTEGVKKKERTKTNINQPKNNTEPLAQSPAIVPTQPNVETEKAPTTISNEKFFEGDKNKDDNAQTSTTPTLDLNKTQATIIIGGFADKNNINRLKRWIAQNNYGLYERRSGGLTVIGAEVSYENKQELNRLVRTFRSRFGDEIEVQRK